MAVKSQVPRTNLRSEQNPGWRAMPQSGPAVNQVSWPSSGYTLVPFRLYTDADQYALEQERIFKGPTWNYLCLAAEVPNPGDYLVTSVGETPVVVARNEKGELHAFVNRCAHRGSLLCLQRRGNARSITCVYHGWSYDLEGRLTGIAFEQGVKRQGGMPEDFKRSEHNLRKLKVAEFCGLAFGSFDESVPVFDIYLGPEVAARIPRVLKSPVRVIGRTTQVLPNNWKLYFENVKDTYHASILHLFFTTFEINRLTMPGGIYINQDGGNHVSFAKLDYAAEDM